MTRALLLAPAVLAACSAASAGPGAGSASGSGAGSGSAAKRRPAADPVGAALAGKACTAATDCAKGETCFAPDFTPGRGVAPRCSNDRQCPASKVCGGYDCMPRCTAASCGTNMRCAASGHCEVLPCTDPNADPCPQNHRCGASGACERMACTSAKTCDAGTCWNGRCFAHGGACAPASYCCPP
nr:hypothetical protein [Kofleriaceae bacterium]